ncbi:MAG: TIGR04283 family arsenosugar biosynthesis glycosyltransferase [bacterium]|nr:TIGR04283 family arsenosugar biosynthesis glycosyltransferase [bacterium]
MPSNSGHEQGSPLRLSVIVPTLNEQAHLHASLASVSLAPTDELIIVDGGSRDATQEIARQFTPHVLDAPQGRARQMNAGARQSQGHVLLFLHADTQLPPGGLDSIRVVMRQHDITGGAFRLNLTPPTLGLRLVAWGANLRTRIGRLPYGDQALFIRRSLFKKIGGYADTPFLEDVQLVKALRQNGKLAIIPQAVMTSGRRWQDEGLIYTTVRNNVLMLLYGLGVSPATLKRWYR